MKNNIADIIGSTFAMLIMALAFYMALHVVSAMEDQMRCERGATEYCIGGQDD